MTLKAEDEIAGEKMAKRINEDVASDSKNLHEDLKEINGPNHDDRDRLWIPKHLSSEAKEQVQLQKNQNTGGVEIVCTDIYKK
jgi:hypothetical protein